ncbi:MULTISPECIES: type II toxin-antitoxin system HicA family toxin [unclassified Pseudomonas]|uniref:type II toxin-antitoxin system HicA family toxin n=1 Tax=unclassified Pseudomonas TaxID=196821 RepID=UPI002455BE07|nr:MULTISPECIES: type II toxin-antitoxin system HicA family toxin [unclassified Pseudomonas]MDH4564544.1 type II toxin-antitoxin system HicA family toxin [Pseudomonas sp. BN411]MDH4655333.1 type II toxin-antitoxin system HicA family toxin [Pseudomonas sp. BN606]
MSSAHELCCNHKRLLPLVVFALREDWKVHHTAGGHLTFTKPGLSPIFTSSTASDYRANENGGARKRRGGRCLQGAWNG